MLKYSNISKTFVEKILQHGSFQFENLRILGKSNEKIIRRKIGEKNHWKFQNKSNEGQNSKCN